MHNQRALIAGILGATAGAVVWLGCSWLLEAWCPWMAVVVGLAAGAAVRYAREDSEPSTSLSLACASCALVAILLVSYRINAVMADRQNSEFWNMLAANSVNEESMIATVADEIVLESMEQNKPIEWPDPQMTYEQATWPHDYPEEIWSAAEERWFAFSDEERDDRTRAQAERVQAAISFQKRPIQRRRFAASLAGWNMLWIGLGLLCAWRFTR